MTQISRRELLSAAAGSGFSLQAGPPARLESQAGGPFKYRVAFELWINDVRNEALALENWPSGILDDTTVDGIIRALDVQSAAGYNAVDFCGLLTTYAWPVDIQSVADRDRQRRVKKILSAAHERKIKVICFPSGVLSWGFDKIIEHDPAVRGDSRHVMNPLKEESWEWQRKVFDFVLDNYEIDGIHLESADQGRCKTKECMERWPNDVAYHCYVTQRTAESLRRKRKDLLLLATIQGFSRWGRDFTQEETAELAKLSQSVDCLFDQGHAQTYVPKSRRREFIQHLHCDYGTSGGLWVYPPQRWDRGRWFLPYTIRTGAHIQKLHADGGRGVMYYQGPVLNPGVEVNVAFGGKAMSNPARNVHDALSEVIESLYRPKNAGAHRKLVDIFERAENAYFGQWDLTAIQASRKIPPPGELHLTSLFGTSPNAADYLREPYLSTAGRLAYKQSLVEIYKSVSAIEGEFDCGGRIGRIKKGIEAALIDINNIAAARGETKVADDRT